MYDQENYPSLTESIMFGDYAEVAHGQFGGYIKMGVVAPALLNPSVGTGLFLGLPAMLLAQNKTIGTAIEKLGLSPLIFGHMNLNTRGPKNSVLHAIEDYANKAHISDVVDAAKRPIRRDKWFKFLTHDTEVFRNNRAIRTGLNHMVLGSGGLGVRGTFSHLAAKTGSRWAAGWALAQWGAMRALPVAGWGLLAWDTAKAGVKLKKAISDYNRAAYDRMRGGNDTSSQMANGFQVQTERRRSLQVIQQSRMNARRAFGYEARQVHM